jgi:hypothetical protein
MSFRFVAEMARGANKRPKYADRRFARAKPREANMSPAPIEMPYSAKRCAVKARGLDNAPSAHQSSVP